MLTEIIKNLNMLLIYLLFCPVCVIGILWPNGWMDEDATWYGGRPRPRRHCVTWRPGSAPFQKGGQQPHHFRVTLWYMGTQLPQRKGAQQPPPTFLLMSVVAKRSPISATAELLLLIKGVSFFAYISYFFAIWPLILFTG